MTFGESLVDSNVLIAAVIHHHQHHEPSQKLLQRTHGLVIAGHSFAEAYSQLTRRGPSAPIGLSADQAWQAIEALTTGMRVVGLSPEIVRSCVHDYARTGGIGARLYDWLIGQSAVHAGVGTIVSWNSGHMRSLFPQLEILTPDQALA